MGNRMSMPVKSNLPLMINMAGMIPIIFAQSLLTFPAIVASYFLASTTAWVANLALTTKNIFGGTSPWYGLLYFLFVVAFTFFYTDVLFTQQNYGENLKKQGAQIPGVIRGSSDPKVPDESSATHHTAWRTLPGFGRCTTLYPGSHPTLCCRIRFIAGILSRVC